MNHLNDDQLSARLDGALNASDDAAAGRHLADCAECRDRLAALSELEVSLRGALSHDPGEAYFASFAERVSEKIAASAPAGAPERAANAGGGLFGWWRSPRMLALVGSTAAVLAVAAIAFVMSRDHGVEGFAKQVAPKSEVGTPPTAERAAEPMADAVSPPEAAPQSAAPSVVREEARRESAPQAPQAPPARSAAPPRRELSARAQEVRTLPGGEPSVVVTRELPFSKERSTPAANLAPGAGAVRATKPQAVSPMSTKPAPAVTPAPNPPAAVSNAERSPAPITQNEVSVPAPVATPAPQAATPQPAEPARRSRFDVKNLLERAKSSTTTTTPSAPQQTPRQAPPQSSQSFGPQNAGSSSTFAAPPAAATPPAPGATSRSGRTTDATSRFMATPYEAAARTATLAEQQARRTRSGEAWDRAGAAWSQAASVARDEDDVRAARRSAAEARRTALQLEPTAARRGDAIAAVEAWAQVAPAGAQQDEARRWLDELRR